MILAVSGAKILMRRTFIIPFILFYLVAGFFLPKAKAQDGTDKQHEVYIGVYMNQIPSLSLKDNQFTADFWIWFRWKGDDIKPVESFDLVNGHIESKESLYEDRI
ncbi:MAG: hypothetical protein HYU99_09360, partial [Deltaproteobacteria bacterium]|nr:hypothetical protein [Deltaproteobacteria bacterium]